ncbi:unnamed protein product [Arctogadus glacialis]
MVLTGRLRQNSQYLKEVRGLPGLEQAVLSRRAGPWSRTSRSLCHQAVLDQGYESSNCVMGAGRGIWFCLHFAHVSM